MMYFRHGYQYDKDFLGQDTASQLFTELKATVPWERPTINRDECWMNDDLRPYTYGGGKKYPGRTYLAHSWHPSVKCIRDRIEHMFGHCYQSCFLNSYHGQHDWLGWHADDSEEINHHVPIIIVSVGAPRQIQFKSRTDETDRFQILLENGSLCVMPAGTQQTFLHRIPKTDRPVNPRISLTFRALLPIKKATDELEVLV